MNSYLPQSILSEEEKLVLERELSELNVILSLHHGKIKSKINKSKFFANVVKNNNGSDLNVDGVIVPAADVQKICRIKEIEWELICAFSGLFKKLAHKWSSFVEDKAFDADDLLNEAINSAVYSIVHFTGETRYMTYVYNCVNRHLSKICAREGGLSGISNDVIKNKRTYQKLRLEEGSTFDSVVDKMGLSESQARRLQFSLTKVHVESEVTKEDQEFIVTETRMKKDILDMPNFGSLISNLDLSDLERAVLEGFMQSKDKLGIGTLSKKLINPKTNKPYSRMSFTFAWQRVKKKIVEAYEKAA